MTILYADDDEEDRELMSEALTEIDPSISCLVAHHGENALNILNETDELPDYIFLDVNMPVMDGKTCLMELKKDIRYKDIPVIIYSTTSDEQEIDELYELGASSFIKKSNDYANMCSTLTMFVKLVQS